MTLTSGLSRLAGVGRRRRIAAVVLGGVSLGVVACDSTGVGNPITDGDTTTLQLAIVGDDTPEPEVSVSTEVVMAVLTIDRYAWFGCDGQELGTGQGPYAVDLIGQTVSPPLAPLEVTEPVCSLQLFTDPNGETPVLQLSGRGQDGAEVRVDLSSELPPIDVTEPEGFDPREAPAVILAFRPRQWIDGPEGLAVALAREERKLVLDDGSPLLRDRLLTTVAETMVLYQDLNEDGRLDPSERTEEAVLGRARE